jgi:hypothetical protein
VDFDAYGRSDHLSTAANLTKMLVDLPEALEMGVLGGQYDATAGNATLTITVPAGKYWRLLSLAHVLVTDANVANRIVTIKPSDSTPTAFSTITHIIRAASGTQYGMTLFESGDADIAGDTPGDTVRQVGTYATGSVSMVTNPTDGDTVTIGGITYTFLDELVDAEDNIHIGAAAANTQANLLYAILGTGGTPGTDYYTSQVANEYVTVPTGAWAANVLTVQARWPGEEFNDATWMAEDFTDETDHVHEMSGGVDINWPEDGTYLGPGEKLVVTVANGVAGDALKTWLTYLSFDNDPRPA